MLGGGNSYMSGFCPWAVLLVNNARYAYELPTIHPSINLLHQRYTGLQQWMAQPRSLSLDRQCYAGVWSPRAASSLLALPSCFSLGPGTLYWANSRREIHLLSEPQFWPQPHVIPASPCPGSGVSCVWNSVSMSHLQTTKYFLYSQE